MRNGSDESLENIKTHLLCSNFSPRKSCRLWDNLEKCGTARQGTGDDIIWRIRFACWITKARNTHSEYVILLPTSRSADLLLGELTRSVHFMWPPCLAAFMGTLWHRKPVCAANVEHPETFDEIKSNCRGKTGSKFPANALFQNDKWYPKTNTCITFWQQCICSCSSRLSFKEFTFVQRGRVNWKP